MSLPKFVVFGAFNNRYARCVKEENEEIHRFIRFDAERIMDPLAKFEIETAESTGNNGEGLVHIRCFYNNKYLARQSSSSTWIVAASDEPDEDRSSWSCTLFQPTNVGVSVFRLIHVNLGGYVRIERIPSRPQDTGIYLRASSSIALPGNFQFEDWESIVVMPKHVAFKGDNGKYLSARVINGNRLLQFDSDDVGDPTVGFEVLMANDGRIRIKSEFFGTIWRSNQGWIFTDGSENVSYGSSEFFRPLKIDNNFIALRNSANNNFCRRFSGNNLTSCLSANVSTVTRYARLEVTEIVISRQINNVRFRLLDARIYNERALVLTTGEAINKTEEPNDVELDFSYAETTSRTWNTNTSVTAGVEAEVRARIPFLAEKRITVSTEVTQAFEFGKTVETTTQLSTRYTVTVPPMTLVRVALLATEATYDVPFSYSQRDVLVNGQWIRYEMDDGMFTGVNAFNFRYEAEEEKLSPGILKMTKPNVGRSAL